MYMKRFFSLLVIVLMVQLTVQAQTAVQYITHTIQKGETLSALSVKYKTTVGDIMRLNGMNSSSKLSIGQKVKIPVNGAKVPRQEPAVSNTTPASQPVVANTPAAVQGTPVTNATIHVVEKGETLYKISRTYHVTVDQLKQWNHLTSNNVAVGQHLAVGAGNVTVVTQPQPQPATQPAGNDTPVQQTAPSKPVTAVPVDTPASQPSTTTQQPAAGKSDTGKTPAANPAIQVEPKEKEDSYVDPSKIRPEGYFASLFGADVAGRTLTDTTGTSMTFKTASGWTDKKYYILINNVAPGSIVKVSVPGNNKVIYAKVLWNMNDMKENEGLAFRISNAAAEALGITDLKFQLKVSYYD